MAKKLIILGILLLVSIPAFAQVDTGWVRIFEEGGYKPAIAIDNSGNAIVVFDDGQSSWTTIKYQPDGVRDWVRTYIPPACLVLSGNIVGVAVDSIGNIYLAGSFVGLDPGWWAWAVVKYSPNGTLLWDRTYDTYPDDSLSSALDFTHRIAVGKNGDLYETGWSYQEDDGYWGTTVKFDNSGGQRWVARRENEFGHALALDALGNVYVTGSAIGSGACPLIKYDTDGNELWARYYLDPASTSGRATDVAVDRYGNVYMLGWEYIAHLWQSVIVKYDSGGAREWARHFSSTTQWPYNNSAFRCRLGVDSAGNVLAAAPTQMAGSGLDYMTVKYDPDGTLLWERFYNGPANGDDVPWALTVDYSGNVFVTGSSLGSSLDFVTLGYDAEGNDILVRRYDRGGLADVAFDAAVDTTGNVFVTGESRVPRLGNVTIKYARNRLIYVGDVCIKAKEIMELGDNDYKALDSLWVGDSAGRDFYLYLGDDAEVTVDLDAGTVGNILFGNVHLSAKDEDYEVDAIASLTIDAQEGQINFEGTVHYSEEAIFQSSFTGACTLLVNQNEIYGRVQFNDAYFGTIGVHAGSWKLDSCAFFGIHNDFNVTVPIGLTDLTVIDGQVTLGVFPNTGIFRVGLTNGAMEFKETGGAFGFDLTGLFTPPGAPSQGMIDVDLAHLRVNVVKDIPIGLWEYPKKDSSGANPYKLNSKTVRTDWSSLRKTDQNTYVLDVYDAEGNKYQKALIGVGLTIKGEEPYTDLDCDGYHDPGEAFEDEDGDGEWDEGTNFSLSDNTFNGHGHVTLDLSLASYIHFTGEDAVVDVSYPEHHRIDTELWYGLKLGSIFEVVDLATVDLHLDYENQRYWGGVTVRHPEFQDLVVVLDSILIAFNPFEFRGEIGADFNIEGVQFLTADFVLHVDERGFYTTSYLDAYGLLHAEGTFFIRERKVFGSFLGDFHIDGWHIAQLNNKFYFAPNQCMSGTGSAKLCLWKLCKGFPFSYRICSATDWMVNVGGLSISLGSPANLHIYDSQGRHTGINPEGGVDTEIPGSEFYVFEDIGQQLAFLPDPDLMGGYTIDVEGLADSVFDFNILYPNKADGNAYNVGYFEEFTQEGALHRVNLDVNNIWTLLNDLDGDSVFESQTEPDSTAEAILDTTMVAITSVSSEILCANEVNVTWNTNVPATSEVHYRSEHDSVYQSVSDTTLTTSHSVLVDDILTTDTYYYIVVSVDTSGNIASFLEKSFSLEYVVGDVNVDGLINIGDVVYLISYLYRGGPAPNPLEVGDVTCDGVVNIGDVVYLISYLYRSGPPPCR